MKITILFIILFFSIGATAQTVECATGTFIKTVKTNPPTFGGFDLPLGPPEVPPPTLPPPPPTPNDRAIFWVHGLGGSQNSWAEAAASTAVIDHAPGFPARRADCVNEPKYYIHLHARNAYRDAYLWFEHADADWKLIIGAKDFVLAPGECQCTHLPPDEFSETIGNIGSASACATFASTHSDEFEYCDWVAYLTETYHESDGIVPIESQKGYPNVAFNNRMEETNHLQMTNCSATKDALKNLYNTGAGESWFVTDPK